MSPPLLAPSQQSLLDHFEWARSLALGMARDAHLADDLVQEAYRIGLEKPPQHPGKTRAWLAQVIRNNLMLHYRGSGRRRRREEKVARPDSVEERDLTMMERTEALEVVGRNVLGLPEPFQGTLLLHYWDDLSLKEIASRSGVPVRTVESRLRKGRDLMRERLDDDFSTEGAWSAVLLPLLLVPPTPVPAWKPGLATGACAALLIGGIAFFGQGNDQAAETSQHSVTASPPPQIASLQVHPVAPLSGVQRRNQQPPSSEASATTVMNSKVEFSVVEDKSGSPLAGIEVPLLHYCALEDARKFGLKPLWIFPKGKGLAILHEEIVTSDANGIVTTVAAPGARHIQINAELFSPDYSLVHLDGANERRLNFIDNQWTPLELELVKRFGSVQGYIYAAADQSTLDGAKFQFWQGNLYQPPRSIEFEAAAQGDGHFVMNKVISETRGCSISATAPGWVSPFVYRAWPDFGPDFNDIQFPMVPAHPLEIQVSNSEGRPLAKARVVISQREQPAIPDSVEGGSYVYAKWAPQSTAANGNTRFNAVPKAVQVEVRAAGFGYVKLDVPDNAELCQVQLNRGTPLLGRVRNQFGQAIESAAVTLICAEGQLNLQSNEDGSFEFKHISRDQRVRLQIHKAGFAWWLSEPLDIDTVAFQDISLQPALTISGQISSPTDTIKLKDYALHVKAVDPDVVHGFDAAKWAPTFESVLLPDGRFMVKDLPRGEFLLKLTTPDKQVWSQRARAGDQDVVIGPEQNLLLQQLSGTMFLEGEGTTVAFAQLQAFRIDGNKLNNANRIPSITLVGESIAANDKGYFELPVLPPGKYSLCCWDPKSGRHYHPTVQLPEDAHQAIEITLPETRSFDFVVVNGAGTPLQNAQLQLVDSNSTPHPLLLSNFPNRKMASYSDAQGHAHLEGVPLDRDLELLVFAPGDDLQSDPLRITIVQLVADGAERHRIILQ